MSSTLFFIFPSPLFFSPPSIGTRIPPTTGERSRPLLFSSLYDQDEHRREGKGGTIVPSHLPSFLFPFFSFPPCDHMASKQSTRYCLFFSRTFFPFFSYHQPHTDVERRVVIPYVFSLALPPPVKARVFFSLDMGIDSDAGTIWVKRGMEAKASIFPTSSFF